MRIRRGGRGGVVIVGVACLALSYFPVTELAAEPELAAAASAAMSSPSGHLEQH